MRILRIAPLVCLLGSLSGQGSATRPPPDPHEADLLRCRTVTIEDPRKGIELAQSILNADHLTAVSSIAALDCLAHAESVAGSADAAISAENQALTQMEKTALPDGARANLLSNAGGVFQMAGDTRRASALLEQSLSLARSKNLPDQQIAALVAIAELYEDALNEPLAAEPYFRQAIDLIGTTGHDSQYVHAFFNYGNDLLKLRRFDDALRVLDRVIELADGKDEGVRFRAEASEARIFFLQKNFIRARELLSHATSGQQRIGDKRGEAESLLALASLDGSQTEAFPAAQRALSLGEEINSADIQIEAMRLMAASDSIETPERAEALTRRAEALEASTRRPTGGRKHVLLGVNWDSSDSQWKDQEIQYQNQFLQEQMGIQAVSIRRATMLRNALIGLLVAVVVLACAFVFYQRRVSRRFERLSTTDPLCGLLNRRETTRLLTERKHSFDPVTGKRIGVFLVDADFFKSVNDQYGHDAGDLVLIELASRLRAACRPDDLVARWGGEEFLIAAWSVTPQEASTLAERLRATMDARPIRLPDGQEIVVTVSVGFALYPFFPLAQDENWRDAFYLADRALYSVKESGRNAWAGLWGMGDNPEVKVRAIHDDPISALRNGWISTSSSNPGVWGTVLEHAS